MYINTASETFHFTGSDLGNFEFDDENTPPSWSNLISWEYVGETSSTTVPNFELSINTEDAVTISHNDLSFDAELSYGDNSYVAANRIDADNRYLFEIQFSFEWIYSIDPPENVTLTGTGLDISYSAMPAANKVLFEEMIGRETNDNVDGHFSQVSVVPESSLFPAILGLLVFCLTAGRRH